MPIYHSQPSGIPSLEQTPATGSVAQSTPFPTGVSPDDTSHGAFSGYRIVQLILGALLMLTAILKAHALATGPYPGSSIFTSRPVLIAVVEFELVLSLWLLIGFWPRIAWAVAIVTFAGFAGVSLHRGLSGETECGCFGRVEVNPWYMFLIDCCALVALLRWRPNAGLLPGLNPNWQTGLAFCGNAACIGILAAWWMTSYVPTTLGSTGEVVGQDELVVLAPEEWVGKKLPLQQHIDVSAQLASGKWRLVLYHHDCAKCREVIPLYEQLAAARHGPEDPRIVLIAVPPYAEPGAELVSVGSSYLTGRLSDSHKWFVHTPTELMLDNGIVTQVKELE